MTKKIKRVTRTYASYYDYIDKLEKERDEQIINFLLTICIIELSLLVFSIIVSLILSE